MERSLALVNMESSSIARVLIAEFVCRFELPDIIHTDQGKYFDSGLIKEVCELLGIKKTRSTPSHPESDGLVQNDLIEHCSKFLACQSLIMNLTGTFNFRPYLWPIEQVSMKHQGETPYYLMF